MTLVHHCSSSSIITLWEPIGERVNKSKQSVKEEVILYCPKGFQPRSVACCSIPVTSMSRGRKRVNLEQIPVDRSRPLHGEDNQRERGVSFPVAFQNSRVPGPASSPDIKAQWAAVPQGEI